MSWNHHCQALQELKSTSEMLGVNPCGWICCLETGKPRMPFWFGKIYLSSVIIPFNCYRIKIQEVCVTPALSLSTCQYKVSYGSQEGFTSCKVKCHLPHCNFLSSFPSCGKEWLRGKRNHLTSNHRRKNESPPTSSVSVFVPFYILCASGLVRNYDVKGSCFLLEDSLTI